MFIEILRLVQKIQDTFACCFVYNIKDFKEILKRDLENLTK